MLLYRLHFLLFFFDLALPRSIDLGYQFLIVLDLALDLLSEHALVVIDDLIELLFVLLGRNCFLQVILKLKLIQGVSVELVETRARDLPIVHNCVGVVKASRRLIGLWLDWVADLETSKLGTQRIRKGKGIIRTIIGRKGTI